MIMVGSAHPLNKPSKMVPTPKKKQLIRPNKIAPSWPNGGWRARRQHKPRSGGNTSNVG